MVWSRSVLIATKISMEQSKRTWGKICNLEDTVNVWSSNINLCPCSQGLHSPNMMDDTYICQSCHKNKSTCVHNFYHNSEN